jgi:hypothetical protein
MGVDDRFGARMLAGIALEMVDGGTLDRIAVSNITMTAVRVPIFLRLGNRARPIHDGAGRPGMGSFQNVSISHVVARASERIGCSITGLPGHPIRNVTLSDIRLVFPGGGTADDASRVVPERPEAYPECTMFGVLPAYAFYCRHVDGLTLDDVKVEWEAPDARPAVVCDDVRGLEIAGLTPRGSVSGPPVISLRDVKGALLRGCVAPEGSKSFLRILGASSGICALANDLGRAASPFEIGEDVGPTPRADGLARDEVLYQAGNRLPRPAGK